MSVYSKGNGAGAKQTACEWKGGPRRREAEEL